MAELRLLDFQKRGLESVKTLNHVLFAWEMGTGKTYLGSEKLRELNAVCNLCVCQKSKIDDWINHFRRYYANYDVYDLTKPKSLEAFMLSGAYRVGVINYDLVWRREGLKTLRGFTLLLDESSLIQHETTKRTRFILRLQPENVILLTGSVVNGKYEYLWSQLHLLGWQISKTAYWNTYVDYYIDRRQGFPLMKVRGYKMVDRLKSKLYEYGCRFMKAEEAIELPEQNFIEHKVNVPKGYWKFKRTHVLETDGELLEGANPLTQLLGERKLCSYLCAEKIEVFKDILDSTSDRIIVFYNFYKELDLLIDACKDRPYGVVNGEKKDVKPFKDNDNGVLFAQYQSASYGLNLQEANRIVYFSPTLSSEMYEQSKKRVHRLGQERPCFYHLLICKDSVEEKIYKTLAMRRDYTLALFEKGEEYDL